MPSNWSSTVPAFRSWSKEKRYSPVTDYRDDGSVDGEKGELLQERGSLSLTSDDGLPSSRISPSKSLHRMSIGLNIILICTNFALVLFSWPELVMKYDKFNNGLLKRISKPCMAPSQIPIHFILTCIHSPNPESIPRSPYNPKTQRLPSPQTPSFHLQPRTQRRSGRRLEPNRKHQPYSFDRRRGTR